MPDLKCHVVGQFPGVDINGFDSGHDTFVGKR